MIDTVLSASVRASRELGFLGAMLADQEDDIDEYQEGGTQHVVAKSEFVVELAEGVYQSLL